MTLQTTLFVFAQNEAFSFRKHRSQLWSFGVSLKQMRELVDLGGFFRKEQTRTLRQCSQESQEVDGSQEVDEEDEQRAQPCG